ncbi:hypothetical protein ABI59_19920 [Acidobacteria bacterium Mor1]|nr:hypothetical protein ABI59_19920 [Acidobacteria bacterium Mor1]
MRRILPCLAALLLLAPVLAADWPQWRGPNRDGKAPDTDLLQNWPEGGPKLAWSAAGLGAGYSSVAVVGDRVYTVGDLSDGQHAIAVQQPGGKILWKTRIGPIHEDQFIGSRSTPTVVDGHVYLVSTESEVYCLSAKDGSVKWKRNLIEEFGGALMKAMGKVDWKYSESPLVDDGKVIVTPGGKEALLVALNAKNGKEVWRTPAGSIPGDKGRDGAGYSSVVVSNAAGVKQYVQLVGRGVLGVDAKTGKQLWSYNKVANDVANISTPLIDGDHVFVSTGYGTGSALLHISKKDGKQLQAREVYWLEADTLQNHHGGLVLHKGVVYTGTGHNKGFPIAVDMQSGKVLWGPARNKGNRSAAIAFADDRLYFRYENGLVVLIEATPEGYKERGSFTIPEVKQFSWPHPVIADGKLYLREQENLYVYDIKARAE